MKSFLTFLILVVIAIKSTAQIVDPAHWSHKVKDLGKGEFDIELTVTLDKGWHIFSKDYIGISVATLLTLEKNKDFIEVGKLRESGKLKKEVIDIGGESISAE